LTEGLAVKLFWYDHKIAWSSFLNLGQAEACPYKTIVTCRDAILRARFSQILSSTFFCGATSKPYTHKKEGRSNATPLLSLFLDVIALCVA
jgi:hypothetical protein